MIFLTFKTKTMELIKSTIRLRNEDEIKTLQKARELYPDKTDNDIFNIALNALVFKVQEMETRISELMQSRSLELEKFYELQKLAGDLFSAENTVFNSKQKLFQKLNVIE